MPCSCIHTSEESPYVDITKITLISVENNPKYHFVVTGRKKPYSIVGLKKPITYLLYHIFSKCKIVSYLSCWCINISISIFNTTKQQ